MQYWNKYSCYYYHEYYLRMPCLNTWTAYSASPFEEGWYGAVCIHLIPFTWQNSLNSVDTNCVPLSKTTVSGISTWAINCLRYRTVGILVGFFIQNTSMRIRNIMPSMGPAKSMCNIAYLVHGCVHRRLPLPRMKWSWRWIALSCWYSQCLITFSISWSKLGHHTKFCARAFILDIPGWAPCTVILWGTTRIPHKLQPAQVENSICLFN